MPRAISEIKAILAERRNAVIRAQDEQRRSSRPHHGFDPNEPRVPAGNPDGGQWTSSGRNDSRILSDAAPDNDWQPDAQYAQARGRGSGRGRSEPEPGQAARLALAEGRASNALARVRQVDPSWRSKQPSYYGPTVESEIRKLNDFADEAEARIEDLVRLHRPLIDAYWLENNPPNLFGVRRDRSHDTISVIFVDRNFIFGSNSTFPAHIQAGKGAGFQMRSRLVANHSDVVKTEGNLGRFPNDAVFHAEATALMRAAKANGGTLAGRTLQVYSDRDMCDSCIEVLPRIGLELGNPRVTLVGPGGSVRTMHNGEWQPLGGAK
jgi:hypothetical protein